MTDQRVQKVIDFPSDLKRALILAADEHGTNMNDVAVQVLADAFEFDFTPSGKGTPGLTDAARTSLSMPRKLRKKINIAAARQEVRATDLMVSILCEHFDLPIAA